MRRIAAIVALVCLRVDWSDRRRFEDSQERAKQQRIEKARAYLAELAGRIDKLPVDATLLSEIESHYFEEQASGAFYVWAMDTKGDFQFGVPQAAFNKVNAVYDSEVTPRLKEGVFLDRQTFLMSLVDDSARLWRHLDECARQSARIPDAGGNVAGDRFPECDNDKADGEGDAGEHSNPEPDDEE